jgi:hypothetical protein
MPQRMEFSHYAYYIEKTAFQRENAGKRLNDLKSYFKPGDRR